MKRAIIYTRYSPRPDEGEAKSIEYQRDVCGAWCKEAGIPVEAYFADEAISGAADLDKRPALMEAIKGLRKDYVLVVHKWDRLARSVANHCAILQLVEDAGAEAYSVSEEDASSDLNPENELLRIIMAALSQYGRGSNAKRTSEAMKSHQRNGLRMTRMDRLPYGYAPSKKDSRKVVKNPEEQAVIKKMLEMQHAGLDEKAICHALSANRIFTRAGNYFGTRDVRRILMREAVS